MITRGDLPQEFFNDMPKHELMGIVDRNGFLTKEQCAKLFRMLDIQQPPTDTVQLLFERKGIEAYCKQRSREKRKLAPRGRKLQGRED